MKRVAISCLSVFALLPAAVAFAQIDPGANGVGIYFDQAATVTCLAASPAELVTGYVLATRLDPATGGIAGFALSLVYDSAAIPGGIAVALPPTGVNFVSPPYYLVGFQSPLPYSGAIRLLTFSFLYTSGTVLLGLGGNSPCSLYDCFMGFAAANDPGRYVLLHPAANVPWPDRPSTFVVAGVNAGPDCPVASQVQSWTAVKRLFR